MPFLLLNVSELNWLLKLQEVTEYPKGSSLIYSPKSAGCCVSLRTTGCHLLFSWVHHSIDGLVVTLLSKLFSLTGFDPRIRSSTSRKGRESMNNLETTKNKNQKGSCRTCAGIVTIQYSGGQRPRRVGSLSVETSEEGRTRKSRAHFLQWPASHARVNHDVLPKTGNAIAAVSGSANTNEKHHDYFLRSGLKIMSGERVVIQAHHHYNNQIETRTKSQDFSNDRNDCNVQSKNVSERGHPDKQFANKANQNKTGKITKTNLLTSLSDCFDYKGSSDKKPGDKHHAFMAQPKTGDDKKRKHSPGPGRKELHDKKREPLLPTDQATIEMLARNQQEN